MAKILQDILNSVLNAVKKDKETTTTQYAIKIGAILVIVGLIYMAFITWTSGSDMIDNAAEIAEKITTIENTQENTNSTISSEVNIQW